MRRRIIFAHILTGQSKELTDRCCVIISFLVFFFRMFKCNRDAVAQM
jgi:hypothetical protein